MADSATSTGPPTTETLSPSSLSTATISTTAYHPPEGLFFNLFSTTTAETSTTATATATTMISKESTSSTTTAAATTTISSVSHVSTQEERLSRAWRNLGTAALQMLSKSEMAIQMQQKQPNPAVMIPQQQQQQQLQSIMREVDEAVVTFLKTRMEFQRLLRHVEATLLGKAEELESLEAYIATEPKVGITLPSIVYNQNSNNNSNSNNVYQSNDSMTTTNTNGDKNDEPVAKKPKLR